MAQRVLTVSQWLIGSYWFLNGSNGSLLVSYNNGSKILKRKILRFCCVNIGTA